MKIGLFVKLLLFAILANTSQNLKDTGHLEKSSIVFEKQNAQLEKSNMLQMSKSSNGTAIEMKGISEISHKAFSLFKSVFLEKSFLISILLFANYEPSLVFLSAYLTYILTDSLSISEIINHNIRKLIDVLAVLFFIILGLIKIINGISITFFDNEDKMLQIQNHINKSIFEETEADINEITESRMEKDIQNNFEIFKSLLIVFFCLILSETGDETRFSTLYIMDYSSNVLKFYSLIISHLIMLTFSYTVSKAVNSLLSKKQVLILSGCFFLYFGFICAHLIYINDYFLNTKSNKSMGDLDRIINLNFLRKN